jgi:hypothetical protein
MANIGWTTILRSLPPAQQEKVAVTTANGVEIIIQQILSVEEDHLVIRGRTLGDAESGSFFIVPFDRINHLSFPAMFREQDIRLLYGGKNESNGGRKEIVQVQVAPTQPGDTSAATSTPTDKEPSVARPAAVDKSNLLERLRARRSMGEVVGPKTNN